MTDYIIGSPDVIFSNSDGLHTFIESSVGHEIRLWIYSSVTEKIR